MSARAVRENKVLDWDIEPDLVCERIRARKSPFKIVTKTKDERTLLSSWIEHHARIAGLENLIIFDNGSEDKQVLKTLKEAGRTALVVRFGGFHNQVHQREVFGKLYAALQASTDYFSVIDTDEMLAWADSATTIAPQSEFVSRLREADLGTTGIAPGLWLDNAWASTTRFRLYKSETIWPMGTSGGKPILSTKNPLPRIIGHNFQLDLQHPEDVNCGRVLVLHLKNLDRDQRINANLRKLRQYKVLSPSMSDSEARDFALSVDIETLSPGNPKQWFREIQSIHRKSLSGAPSDKIAPGEIEFSSDNRIIHFSHEQQLRFEQYLHDPGWFLASALATPSSTRQAKVETSTRPIRSFARITKEEDTSMGTQEFLSAPEEAVSSDTIKISSVPAMTEIAMRAFREHLRGAHCYLEYGSGGSTRQAVRYKIPKIYTVESDPEFGKAVRRAVSWDRGAGEFRMFVPDFGQVGEYGYPRDNEKCGNWWHYPARIWDMIRADANDPDLVLIDGRFRVACFLTSLVNAKPGTIILFDDYTERADRYAEIEVILKPTTLHDRLAEFIVPEAVDTRAAANLMLKYANDRR